MKALKKVDFSKIAMHSVGQLGGLAVITPINRISFIAKIDKPAIKGAVMFAIGALGIPMLAEATGMNKKGSSDIFTGAGAAISTYGLATLGNAIAPNVFPKITGYEDGVYGMGLITDEDFVSGTDDVDFVSGYDDEDVSGIGNYEDGVYG